MNSTAQTQYRSYSTETKLQLINSGNPRYFSHENGVPRTTALYWLKNSHKLRRVQSNTDRLENSKIKELEEKLEIETSLKNLLIKVRKLHPYSFDKKKVTSKKVKKEIILEITKLKKLVKLNTCLTTIGLSYSTYYRWLSTFKRCELADQKCRKRHPNQLTKNELETMRLYLNSKKYAHVPVSSLSLIAQRNGDLFCSLHTWYKYNNMYEWRKHRKNRSRARSYDSLTALHPNQYWHIDVSKFVFGRNTYHFQAIIDNYSRLILAWSVDDSVSADNTSDLIKRAQEFAKQHCPKRHTSIVMDMGTENTALSVESLLNGRNLQRLIARKDILFSNSMIEAFFRSLKNNYFYSQKIRTKEDIKRKINFYVKQHNTKIPKIILNAATPMEAYTETWGLPIQNYLKRKRKCL